MPMADATPAYLSDELGLSEAERAGVEDLARSVGRASLDGLLATIQRNGRIDGVLQAALTLPLAEYRTVENAWKSAPLPERPKTRRRR